MVNNILIFRTDRIGDLIITCPTIFTIKKYFKNSKITIITSEKNYDYAKSLNIFSQIYRYPEKNIIKKIQFIYKLSKKNFDYVFVFDGKDRSILTSILVKSKYKIALTQKNNFLYKIFAIKFFYDSESTNLNEIFQKSLNFCKIDSKINNYNFLSKKKNNSFSSLIPIKNYVHVHLDEKWFTNLYIKSYTNINPNYNEFVDFLNTISENRDVLITTGMINFSLLNELKNKFFKHINDKIYFRQNSHNNIYFIYKPSFEDIESLLRNSYILIACHGSIIHASNSFDVKKIDIIEKSKEKFYLRFTSYLNTYTSIYRSDFNTIKKNIYNHLS